MIKSLFLIAAVATVLSFFILTNAQDDVDVNELEKQWGIEDDFEEELMKRRPPMPEIKPGKKLSPKDMEQLMNTQHAGKPTMLFITMKGDERAENERLAGLKNSHMPVKSFFIEDDHFGLIVDDGKYVPQVIKYLKQQKDIAQITLDQKDLLPPHPKTSAAKEKREREKKEKEERLAKIKNLMQKKKRLAQKKKKTKKTTPKTEL